MSQALKQAKILVVDDERYNINVLNDLLKHEYKVMVAKSGEQALKAAQAGQPDLILLDIIMPDMDGYEVCRRLKSMPELRHIPIIFITAMTHAEDETRGLEMGAADYIAKPFNNAVVQARVHMQMALIQAKRTLEKQNEELLQAVVIREDMGRLMQHDLKGPLTPIIGLSQILLETRDLPDFEQDALTRIRDSGYRMLNMINVSMDMLKMEQGSYELQAQPLHLARVIKHVLSELKTSLAAKRVTAKLVVPDHASLGEAVDVVQGEELLIHSMLSNLIKNALEASSADHVIDLRVEHLNGQVCVRVSNSGDVPEAIRDTFFEKYVTSGKEQGTGLGTYSARLIAQTHGGTIELDSSLPGQTTILVCFPVATSSPL